MTGRVPDFSINISHRRLACVLDPMLALSRYGVPLLGRLGAAMDVWVARELWHILDNTHFYLEHPDELLAYEHQADKSDLEQGLIRTLQDWERIRLENDPARQQCFWIGDSPLESFLPDGIEPDVVWRYELLSAALDQRLANQTSPVPAACRDTASMAICLPSALILTYMPPHSAEERPPICGVFEHAGILCRQIQAEDPWRLKESDLIRQLFVQVGLSKWIWSGLRLAVLHVIAPAACAIEVPSHEELEFTEYAGERLDFARPLGAKDYWFGSQGFWYPL